MEWKPLPVGIDDFEKIEWKKGLEKPRVGIVGEILIKYHPFGNNFVADLFTASSEINFLGLILFTSCSIISED